MSTQFWCWIPQIFGRKSNQKLHIWVVNSICLSSSTIQLWAKKKKKIWFLFSYFSGSFSVSNDRVIDLSSLRSDDDLFVAPNYSINICAPLVTPCVSTIQDSIGCQRDTTAQYSIGKYNQFEYSYDLSSSSLNITYMGGDYGRVTNYIISCATDFVPPYFLNENPVKVYNFVWKTPLVCNQNITKKFK